MRVGTSEGCKVVECFRRYYDRSLILRPQDIRFLIRKSFAIGDVSLLNRVERMSQECNNIEQRPEVKQYVIGHVIGRYF